ncbi:MAG TPA: Gfo/Idh/MocA family oxidoreductase [Chthonomonadaceae bacterium]|nr:Gfo/Idh/MocA family oxidoreductase [Chthonomonadaceae bacterium]
MSEELRVGLLGCGLIGQTHLKVWAQTPGARVVSVYDRNPARACQVAEQTGAHGYASLEALLDAGGLDAVDICTPSGLHADQGLAAARRGLHVLCEKPLDLNLEKADQLIAECEARGLTLACIFQQRVYRGAQQVARLIAEERMGRLLSASAYVKWWRSQDYYSKSGWHGTWALDGGVLANQAIHSIDFLCWLAGPVEEVEYAHLETAAHMMEAEDYALAVLRFANGARGVIEATTCCSPDLCSRVEIFGTRGSVAFDDASVVQFGLDGQDRQASIEQDGEDLGGRSDPKAISLYGHEVLLADFVEAVRTGRKPLVSGQEARVSVEAIHKIYHKAFPNRRLGV